MNKKQNQTHNGLGIGCSVLLGMLTASCVKQEKLVEVEILEVYQHENGWATLIEDEDGMRKRKGGKLGEKGDVFKMRRVEFHKFYSGDKFKYLD